MGVFRRSWWSLLALLLLARPTRAAWPPDAASAGVPACTAGGNLARLRHAVPDFAGGVVTAWSDSRNLTTTGTDVYAQRVDRNGDPQWGPDGIAVRIAPGAQKSVTCAASVGGGTYVAWADSQAQVVQLTLLGPSGATLWPAGPLTLSTATSAVISAVEDASSGLWIAWYQSDGAGVKSVRVQHVAPNGVAYLPAGGVELATGLPSLLMASLAPGVDVIPDGAGGVYVSWEWSFPGRRVYLQRVSAAGTPLWAPGGAMLNGTRAIDMHSMALDAYLGLVIAYQEFDPAGPGTWRVRAQRIDEASGMKQWGTDGVAVNDPTPGGVVPAIATNLVDGAFVAWEDYATHRVRVQRLTGAGLRVWGSNGIDAGGVLDMADTEGGYLDVIEDGANGVALCWRTSDGGIQAQRFDLNGNKLWGADGVTVWTGPASHCARLVWTPTIGYILVSGSEAFQWPAQGNGDVSAKLVWSDGRLGPPGPVITKLSDVRSDQGGKIRVRWTASPMESSPLWGVTSYGVWRRLPLGAIVSQSAPTVRMMRIGALSVAYEKVATVPAYGFAGYAATIPTVADSGAGPMPWTAVMIEAESSYLDALSSPDSAFSVDDLPPFPPTPLAPRVVGTGVRLEWVRGTEPDFAGYRVYRSAEPDFTPGAATLVATTDEAGWTDPAGGAAHYAITALDVHGNESPPARVETAGVRGTSPPPPARLVLLAPSPNPVRSGASALISFDLPAPAHVRLGVFDAAGRALRSLLDAERPAGRHEFALDGLDDRGRAIPAGLYFVRLEAAGLTRVRRVAVMP